MTTNIFHMQQILKISFIAVIAITLASCGNAGKEKKGGVTDIEMKLAKLKKEKVGLDEQIRQLEEQLLVLDPEAASLVEKLVAVDTLRVQEFSHYIELQGKIDAEGMAYVAPSGAGGVVKAIYVKNGSRVKKGQLVLKLDDAVARQQVVTAQQAISGIRAQLDQARSIYERQQNLWKQNIGTEVQVLNAKTNVEALESQLQAAQANVRLAQEAANLSNVYAQISGVVDAVNVKVGEFFSPQSAAMPQTGIRIVNNSNLKIVTNVPENYTSRVNKGDRVEVIVPETGRPAYQSTLSVVGASIDPTNRSFTAEAKLPSDPVLRPNQIATMKILDYQAKAAVAVPVNIVQSDEKGKYVYVMQKEGNRTVARKKNVVVGEAYGGFIEVKSGLSGGEVILTQGYQTVYDGQAITTLARPV